MEIPVLYRDADLVVCLKPVGTDAEGAGMPALLAEQLRTDGVFCVHRLDKTVGGVMVYALNREAAAAISRQISSGDFQKEYCAVIHGAMEKDSDTLCDLLFHDRAKNKSYVVKRKRAGVRDASLSYRVLSQADGLTLLSVVLHTGRTHQIRVQFASRGHSLLGDVKYGSRMRDCPIALWSRAVSFRHPGSGEALRFAALPPSRFPWDRFHMSFSED